MHEIRIAEDLSVIVLEAAQNEKLMKVTGVNIAFGQLVQIVPDIFLSAFAAMVRDSVAEDADVNIEIIPVKLKCMNCRTIFRVRDNVFSCSRCKSTDIEIINGNELFVKSIEGE